MSHSLLPLLIIFIIAVSIESAEEPQQHRKLTISGDRQQSIVNIEQRQQSTPPRVLGSFTRLSSATAVIRRPITELQQQKTRRRLHELHSTTTTEQQPSTSTIHPKQPASSSTKARWLEWSQWSACINDERIRVRSCAFVDTNKKTTTNNNKCGGGNSVDRQWCFSTKSNTTSPIRFASDPWKIEREIARMDRRRRV